MSATVQLRLCGAMDQLRIVWQTGETLLESIPFQDDPEGTRYNVLLAVQEMITNVLRHAYGKDDEQPVLVAFEADDRGIQVEIRDQGVAFNPAVVEISDSDDDGMPQDPGGYGIMIARMVMDRLDYVREGDWNVLSMSKSVHPQPVSARKD